MGILTCKQRKWVWVFCDAIFYQGRHVYRESGCGYFVMISSTRVDMYTEKVGVGIL